jgi:CRP/FNR family cyclic AMP-dependent transcriptional regulator
MKLRRAGRSSRSKVETIIDLRGLPVWERPGPVFEAFDRLSVGDTITYVTENEPRGLGTRIEQALSNQMRIEPLRVETDQWRVSLTRVEPSDAPQSQFDVLRRVAVFADLSDRRLERLLPFVREYVVRKGERISTDGDDGIPFLGIVWEGVAALACTPIVGRDRTFYEIFPFEVFGEIELLDGGMAIGDIVAHSKRVRYIGVPHRAIRDIAAEHPDVLFALARSCAQRARSLAEALTAQAGQPIVARVAQALLPYAPADRGMVHAAAPLPTMTQSQLAAAAGTVKEVAARAIADLEERGALRRERGHIRYLNRALLLKIART